MDYISKMTKLSCTELGSLWIQESSN